jgi:hypothetical protein
VKPAKVKKALQKRGIAALAGGASVAGMAGQLGAGIAKSVKRVERNRAEDEKMEYEEQRDKHNKSLHNANVAKTTAAAGAVVAGTAAAAAGTVSIRNFMSRRCRYLNYDQCQRDVYCSWFNEGCKRHGRLKMLRKYDEEMCRPSHSQDKCGKTKETKGCSWKKGKCRITVMMRIFGMPKKSQ